jgi:hypothetical protein
MKTLFSILYLVMCAIGAMAQTGSQPVPNGTSSETLVGKSRAICEAMKAKDVDQLKSVLAEDFHSVGSEGKSHTKSDLLEIAKDGELKEYFFYDSQVTQIDEGTALVTYNLAVRRPEGDDGLAPRYQKVSDLWVRRGSEWQLKFEQATPLRPID